MYRTASIIASALALTPGLAVAQADNRSTVETVRRILASDYVVVEKRAALDAALRQGLASGRYDAVDPAILAERLTADMAAVAHDGHLGIRHAPGEATQIPQPRDDDETRPDPFWDEQARRWNQGVVETRVFDGNVRYINYRGFMWSGGDGRASAAALDAAAAFLRGGDAIIIDLRQNGGGSPDAVRHFASYFVPANETLVTFHVRSNPPDVSRALASVPGGRITGKPVYVLTSGRTFSAAEEFASHVAHFGFGTLVGATTGGGAYRNAAYPIAGKYVLSVSIGRPELPGGGNWEGRGVKPAIEVPASAALDAAQAHALGTIAKRSQGPDRALAERLARYYSARITPVPLSRPASAYPGRYGERIVRVEGDGLVMQRGGGPVSRLVPLSPDRFALSEDPATQVSFNGTPSVTGLVVERADGRTESVTRGDAG